MTEYNPNLRLPGPADTVLGYDGSGNPEYTLKSSLGGGSLDIDSLPVGTADDTADLMVISDQTDAGTEKKITLADLQSLIGGGGGGSGTEVLIHEQDWGLVGPTLDVTWASGQYKAIRIVGAGLIHGTGFMFMQVYDGGVLQGVGTFYDTFVYGHNSTTPLDSAIGTNSFRLNISTNCAFDIKFPAFQVEGIGATNYYMLGYGDFNFNTSVPGSIALRFDKTTPLDFTGINFSGLTAVNGGVLRVYGTLT